MTGALEALNKKWDILAILLRCVLLRVLLCMMMIILLISRCHVRIYSRPELKKEKQIGDTCMENWRCVEHTPYYELVNK